MQTTADMPETTASGRHFLALATAALTLLMIVAGATVTTIEAGDSDPEWSLRFWEWFRPAAGGLFYELLHRKIGIAIGVLTVLLVVAVWRAERRRWVRWLAWATLLLVIVQGLFGGLRVRAVSDPAVRDFLIGATGLDHAGVRMAIAMVHAFNAQIVLCLLFLITVATSRGWLSAAAPVVSPATRAMRRVAVLTSVLIYVQLVVGAYVRHGRELWPKEAAPHHDLALIVHAALALAVVGHVFLMRRRARCHWPQLAALGRPAGLAWWLALAQLGLGVGSWLLIRGDDAAVAGDLAWLVRTLHVANGAAIFALVVTVTARSWRLLRPGTVPAAPSEAGA